MLTIKKAPYRLCDGWSRRDFIRVGALGSLGLSLPDLLRAAPSRPQGELGFGRAKRCLLLFMTGGPPHLDTWDLKPAAPAEVRGELRPIATSVPGIRVSELLPRLARQADKYCILRSVTHQDTVHTSAGYTMLTGAYHAQANTRTAKNIRTTPEDHPHVGSILAKVRPARAGLPPFVALPEFIRDDAVNDYAGQDAGLLGKRYAPLRIEGEAQTGRFQLPDLLLPPDLTADRFDDRRLLLNHLDRSFTALEAAGQLAELDSHYQQAYGLIRSPQAQAAFQLDCEPDRVRDAYGKHLFGQGCLLARRLLEAGVSLVTVYWHYEGPKDSPVWDTHQNNFPHLRNRLVPPTDQAFARLLVELSERGMLDDTLVVWMGEFGRSPKINAQGGREHWPFVQSVVLAGAGVHGGSVYGASDRLGGHPADLPVTPPDLTATILHLLGIPPDLELRDQTNRPARACQGNPIHGLFA
jgi:hypothetical protein